MAEKKFLDLNGLSTLWNAIKAKIPNKYASSKTEGGAADKAVSIPFGQVDSTSTATIFTAQIDGITELRDGVCVWLTNGVVKSAAGCTLNINNLGAKPIYISTSAASAVSTTFAVAYTMLFIYNSTRVSGGCWDMVYGYNSDTNTIGYQLRTNSTTLPMTQKVYRYRLLFTSADGTKWVGANTSSSTNATASRTPNQTKIAPFGKIVYYASTTAIDANESPGATVLWSQYVITLGYSFNNTGAALVLDAFKPVYIKCAPQSDGSAIIDAVNPYVQTLPSTADGKIYIFLGIAVTATTVEIVPEHPIYCYRNGGLQIWTGTQNEPEALTVIYTVNLNYTIDSCNYTYEEIEAAYEAGRSLRSYINLTNDNVVLAQILLPAIQHQQDVFRYNATIINSEDLATYISVWHYNDDTFEMYTFNSPQPSPYNPEPLGAASPGSSNSYSRADHVHAKPTYTASDVGALPSDTTYVSTVNGQSGAVTINVPSASSATPQALGTASAGSSADFSRADHVHAKPTYTASDVGALPSNTTYVSTVNGSSGAVTITVPNELSDLSDDSTHRLVTDTEKTTWNAKADAITEVTVSTAGAVTQALDAGKIYHFTGALTSLTITLNTPPSGELAYYFFDFTEGSTAFTPVFPNSVVFQSGLTWKADTFYEVDILNNKALAVGW